MEDLAALEAAYRATTYVAWGPAGAEIRIRVGEQHPGLDALLEAQGAGCWAFLTPCNPRSEPQSDHVNATRVAALRTDLDEHGYRYWEGAGVGEGTDWPPEPSFLVLGISRSVASELAVRYEQYAFVFGETGGRAELVWTPVALPAR